MKGEVYERKVDTLDELLARILDAAAAARINSCEDQIRRKKTWGICTRVAKWTKVGGGIFYHLLWTVKKFFI